MFEKIKDLARSPTLGKDNPFNFMKDAYKALSK